MENKHFSKLALKFIAACLLLGIAICATSGYFGYQQYNKEIQKTYNNTAYQVAETALTYTSVEDLTMYSKLVAGYRDGDVSQEEIDQYMADSKYTDVIKQLTNLREKMNANDIFFVAIDKDELNSFDGNMETWEPQMYIYDCYAIPEQNYPLGARGPLNPEFIDEVNKVVDTGERSSNYFVSESQFGFNTSAILPVKGDNGKVVACIGVEIPMTTIKAALQQYIRNSILITIGLIVAFLFLYILYIYRKVVTPINKISHEVDNFLENNNQVTDELYSIKTNDEIEGLAQSVVKMENDINDYITNITTITAEKERIGAELDVATNIQASMLPCIFPAFPEVEQVDVYATMNPAKEVGGDFYDFFMVDDTHVAMVAADVSGKGVPAALFMVIGKTLIKDHTTPGTDLGEVFTTVNNLLCQSNSEGLFITAFEGVLDLVTGEFRYVNAGHETPFISKAGGKFEPYPIKAGFVLAGMEGIKYKSYSIMLEPGDRVFEYTDGVTEATNSDNHLFGMDRLEASLEKNAGKSIHDLLPAVKSDIDEFVGEAPQFDDITMICLEYKSRMQGL